MNASRFTKLRERGFALIVTVSLLVVVGLLLVGILGLSTVATRSSSQTLAEAEARANARMSLIIALGQLQKTMGPDARVSARGETLAQDPRLGVEVASNSPKAWWVGVTGSDPGGGLDGDSAPGPGNPAVVWLVSGLDAGGDPASQIANPSPFDTPVPMYGDKTIDTDALTGGAPIMAGSVTIKSDVNKDSGGFAYFIDDNGMKAQLAASNPNVRNDVEPPLGNGAFPGTYDLGILEGMEELSGTPFEEYGRLFSINDLPLIGADRRIAREKRLGYTTLSRGVLSDVREGGLKKDLTIAFENRQVFDAVFPQGRTGFGEDYLVMDSEKYDQARDLQDNGYIHWEMFRDFYNIKKYIKGGGRTSPEHLDPILIHKGGLFSGYNTPFGQGRLGPHTIGDNGNVHSLHRAMPYGDYSVMQTNKSAENYKHSPVIPILQRMQMNAWLEETSAGRQRKLKTNVQLWTSHYNPFNIDIRLVGDANNAGPRVITYPQVRFSVPGLSVRNQQGKVMAFDNVSGLGGKRQSHVPHEVMLGAGRSHVCAFKNDGRIGAENDRGLFEDKVRNLTLESVYQDYDLVSGTTAGKQLEVEFYLAAPSMTHGADHLGGSHEVSQVFWAPFAWDAVDRKPGKSMKFTSGRGFNENTMASLGFNLRTTREGSGALRPLIDSNIRAMLCNTKWDSPLGVDLLASYSPENLGEMDDPFMPMDTRDNPKGYTYWGAGRDPVDGYDRVILFDIPRNDLVSLGQLQHASVGRFSYEPTYIVGNSYANLRIPLEDWRASVRDSFSTRDRGLDTFAIGGNFNLYDASYIVNEVLWDSYIFTTIPQVADNRGPGPDPQPTDAHFAALLNGEETLANPRFIPYEPPGSSFNRSTLQMSSRGRGETGAFYHNAGHLLVDGLFNVNSTSVDAWEAFLSGTHKLPYQKLEANGSVRRFETDVEGVRFPRVQSVLGGPMEKDNPDENYWTGFRDLEQEEVRELAEAIVAEIRERGPFRSLGEFVNRKLEYGEHGERGALQAALDKTVNAGIDDDFESDAGHPQVPAYSTQGAGFPGQLLQGDILQVLSPYMSVRSDTFTIRSYGESRSSDGKIRARAWCEATVQRFPDPVPDEGATGNALAQLVRPTSKFGRSFRISSFRWLSANEI
ncbi:hypothetical protein HAHE_18790 [Haloferula helveola]|uniref:Verru_Chthon cassette protein A n=1 Tax=Haloferula helveola TaxID=490095 RepID=A0ABN6H2V4_9BACT|nr:hypothetical protein HAHE_18790 [Haloferula helveola]